MTYSGGSNSHNFEIYKQGGVPMTGRVTNWLLSSGWVTYLYHVIPGNENQSDTDITIYAARDNDASYTKIWESLNESIDYQDTYRKAWNAALFSVYHNGINMPEFYHKYDQVIFSKNFIPCPSA